MLGRYPDAAYWLGEALAVPGGGEPTPGRDCAYAIYLIHRADTRPGPTAEEVADDQARLRELADRLLAYPELPGPCGALTAVTLAFLQEETAVAKIARLADGDDVWLAGLAGMFRAQFAENAGELRQRARRRGGGPGLLPAGRRPLGSGHRAADARPAAAVRR